jgi:anti-sigma regulatory factor (Ser/Thr protein kinase)
VTTDAGGAVHDALLYDTDEDLVAALASFLKSGLDADDEAVLLACSARTTKALVDSVGGDPNVGLLPHPHTYQRPAQAISAYQRIVEDQLDSGVSQVRLVGEVEFGLQPRTWREWIRFEAVVNRALAGYPLWSVCIYDTRRLPIEVLEACEMTHPTLLSAHGRVVSQSYLDPADFLRRSRHAPPDPLERTPAVREYLDPADVAGLRQDLRQAGMAGSALPSEMVDEFVYAVSEVATNAVLHGRPPVQVRFWCIPTRLLCTITDHGNGFDDPFAGYVMNPAGGHHTGVGLCLARHFCDHLDASWDCDSFAVRISTGC